MTEHEAKFLGTYFDRDSVMRWSRVLSILAWFVAGIYALDFLVGLGVQLLQYTRGFMVGLGFSDIMQNVMYLLLRPLHGILYFGLLQALSKGLLIALDMEENTRKAARK